jgi:hypothetical protein
MKEARKPNLNAPRFRRSAQGTLNSDFIELLKQKVPSAKDLSAEQIKKIIHTFNRDLWSAAIENRDGVEIPEQVGHLFIGTCPPKRKPNVDFKTSAEYLKVIQHRNWESDQYLAKIFYTTYGTKYRFKNHELWGFVATRDFKRMVGKTYPQKWKQYVEVDPKIKISSMFRANAYKMNRAKDAEKNITLYNEFDL